MRTEKIQRMQKLRTFSCQCVYYQKLFSLYFKLNLKLKLNVKMSYVIEVLVDTLRSEEQTFGDSETLHFKTS